MNAEIIEVCDAVVTVLSAAIATDAVVERAYLSTDKLDRLDERKVYVFPPKYASTLATRQEDQWTHTVGIRVVDKYPDPGEPTRAWVDDLVNFVRFKVVGTLDVNTKRLTVTGTGDDPQNRVAWTLSSDVEVYDADWLAKGVFVSDMTVEFGDLKGFR
jgi:hypothetical protein